MLILAESCCKPEWQVQKTRGKKRKMQELDSVSEKLSFLFLGTTVRGTRLRVLRGAIADEVDSKQSF